MSTVLAFGTYSVRKHPRVGILIDGLRKNGCNVEEINQPLLLSTAQRVEILKNHGKYSDSAGICFVFGDYSANKHMHGRRRMASRMPCWSVIWGISTYYSPTMYLKACRLFSIISFCRRYRERSWRSGTKSQTAEETRPHGHQRSIARGTGYKRASGHARA